MRKVYDYKDLRRLEESNIYRQLQDGVIITATFDLAQEIGSYYPTTKKVKGLSVIDIHAVIRAVVGVWDKKIKDIRNYISLRNIIEEYIAENDLSEINGAYLKRNAAQIWNAIVLLVEADIYPEDIPDNISPPVTHFKYLWKQIEKDNPAFMQLRSTFLFDLVRREYIDKFLPEMVKGKEIFLLGFYFITPIQMRLISALEKAGYKVSYLNGYDKNHPFAFEIWEKTFAEEYENQTTIDIQPAIQTNNCFVESIEDAEWMVKKEKANIIVDAYKTDIEFATACMEAKQSGASLYSADAKGADQILREFYPEEYDNKHLLSYPVGQYIYYLHMMWDEFFEEPILKYEYVFKCFASGWLEDEGINGKEYLYQLKVLEPYFNNCNEKGTDSFTAWKKRTESLLEAKQVTSVFDEQNDTRWKKLLGNPFNNMAIYQLRESDISAINQLIGRLISDANTLFAGNVTKNLHEHMQKIKKIIENHKDKEEIQEDEQIVMKELMDRLDNNGSDGIVCHLNGIKDAIILLIGDHHSDAESHEEETSKKKRLVDPLSKIEASVLSNYGQDIYLVMADEFVLPGKPRSLPWPLSEELVNGLIEKLDSTRADSANHVRAMYSLIKTRPLANRYLYYSLFDNITEKNKPVIHLCWISSQGDKKVAPSPYISLMGWKQEEIEKKEMEDWENYLQGIIRGNLEQELTDNSEKIPVPNMCLPDEVREDYALCKMRYLYAYILNYLPSFSSDFHYSFVLSNMAAAFATVTGQSKEEISEQIYQLFPFLKKVEKRQAVDFAYVYKSEASEYEGVNYPGNRKDVHFLRGTVKTKAEKNAITVFEKGDYQWEIDSENCKYCPYSNICRVKFEGVARYES